MPHRSDPLNSKELSKAYLMNGPISSTEMRGGKDREVMLGLSRFEIPMKYL